MTSVRFYHLQQQSLDQVLPSILEKAHQKYARIIVRMDNQKEISRMSSLLWTYKNNSFLPHGFKKDNHAGQQPIWLTDREENPNNATALILTQGQSADDIKSFELCCEIFDGRNLENVETARRKWAEYKSQGFDVTYWHQSETGKWDQKS